MYPAQKRLCYIFFVLAPLPIQDLELVCSHEPWISGVTNVALDDAGPPHEGKNSLAQKILQRYFILNLNININYKLFTLHSSKQFSDFSDRLRTYTIDDDDEDFDWNDKVYT